MSNLALPFTGPLSDPPKAAFWIAIGAVHDHNRPRIDPDNNGLDCNDHAFDAVRALKQDGRTPYYVQALDERGDPHLFAAYPTQDGVPYARDSRVDGDVPLQYLVDRGYKLLASSDAAGQLWHSAQQTPQQTAAIPSGSAQ